MAFELPTLPYSHGALAERGMCQETLELHHGKHHQAYVTALNGFVEKNPALSGKSLDEVVAMSVRMCFCRGEGLARREGVRVGISRRKRR